MINNGMKPCFVFDGKPPTLKTGELAKRTKKREEAQESKEEAKEEGDKEAEAKMAKRTVKVTKKHNDEAKKLLRLMGVPVVEAPCEAEAQCAAMVKAGLVYATGTEDMDALTLGTPVLLRHLTFSEARKMPIKEIHLNRVIEGLQFTMDQFIDLCILLGCDYCDTIKGIGCVRAFDLISKYGSIEKILETLDASKHPIPANFDYNSARLLFKEPEVMDCSKLELKWTEPDEEALVQFLVKEKNFSEDRVRSGVAKLKKSRQSSVQVRLTDFFGQPTVTKRKHEEDKKPDPKSKKAKIQTKSPKKRK